jgi:hypothetical protein
VTISLLRQVNRIELQIMGERNRLDIVSAPSMRWPSEDIEMKRLALEELEAALRTLRWLHDNEDRIKAALAEGAA